MTRLIVTEKDNSAKKIAQILSQGKTKENKVYTIPYYTWGEGDDGYLVIWKGIGQAEIDAFDAMVPRIGEKKPRR